MAKAKFEIKKSKKNKQYFVRLIAKNGEQLNVSETFKLKGNAVKNINAVVEAVKSMIEDGVLRVEDLTNESDGLEKKNGSRDDE